MRRTSRMSLSSLELRMDEEGWYLSPHQKEVHFLIAHSSACSEMEAKGEVVVDVPSSIDNRPKEYKVRRICFRWRRV